MLEIFKNIFTKKVSKPVIETKKESNTFVPFKSTTQNTYKPQPLSQEAIKSSVELKLPDPKTQMRRTEEWTKAFEWYNLYVNKTGRNLGMSCRPCWTKVFIALKTAKKNA